MIYPAYQCISYVHIPLIFIIHLTLKSHEIPIQKSVRGASFDGLQREPLSRLVVVDLPQVSSTSSTQGCLNQGSPQIMLKGLTKCQLQIHQLECNINSNQNDIKNLLKPSSGVLINAVHLCWDCRCQKSPGFFIALPGQVASRKRPGPLGHGHPGSTVLADPK